ncbi:hypothetical protein PR202_gb25164 [Eleusine coracana subsp. coracana]|uniref:Uncharacterized protein n=1 Tax=Eleusine coracana subsp. coracana TaxID=191504 RepID=A0AAV5FPF2_ELECO|nr:hypothetical protein PR202_gb25164 [Eleusine coracana subsp. coracana]
MPKMEFVLGLSESRRWPGWPTSIKLRIDTGSPWMNRAVHGFLNVGAVAACKVAAEDTSEYLTKGAVAGVYEAMEYGVQRIRGRSDWANAMVGGAITGALVSAATAVAVAAPGTDNDDYAGKVINGAITGGAVATAAELVSRRGRVVALEAPMTLFGSGGISGDGSSSAIRSREWRHDNIVDEEGRWVKARGLELPSTEDLTTSVVICVSYDYEAS